MTVWGAAVLGRAGAMAFLLLPRPFFWVLGSWACGGLAVWLYHRALFDLVLRGTMGNVSASGDKVLSVEVFAAKDSDGVCTGLMMSVPVRCGLKHADSLRISGSRVVAMNKNKVLTVNLPAFPESVCAQLADLARAGQRLAVAEVMPLGLFDAYFLNVEVVS